MTQDDIIKLAQEAGITMSVKLNRNFETELTLTIEQFRFAALVAADATLAIKQALAQEHALHELARLGQEIEQEPSEWRDMIVATLVREGINKHKARELADHFAAQRPWQGLTPEEVKRLYPYGRSVLLRETCEAIEKALKDKNT